MTPEGWQVLPFGEVVERTGQSVELRPENLYREIGIRSHGKGLFHKEPVTGASLGSKRVFSIEPNRLVFNIVFAWEGAVAVTSDAEAGMIASHRFPMFRPNAANRVCVEFLRRFFQMEQGVRSLGEASPGGAGRNRTLNQKLLAAIPLLVPPLPEQQKIAAILSSIDDAIQVTQAVIDQLQVVKKAMMAELLTRGIPGRHTRFKKTDIGEVPEGWAVRRLSELATVQTGLAKGKPVDDAIELPYLRVANVQDGYVDLSEVKQVMVAPSLVERYRLRMGDVLFTEGGDADKLGRGCVWRGQIDPCLHQNHVFSVRPNTAELLPEFLAIWAASDGGRTYFLGCAKQTTNLASINSTQLKALPMPVPAVDEQRELIACLNSVSDRHQTEHQALDTLGMLKSALMSALLTGELRVKPDEVRA